MFFCLFVFLFVLKSPDNLRSCSGVLRMQNNNKLSICICATFVVKNTFSAPGFSMVFFSFFFSSFFSTSLFSFELFFLAFSSRLKEIDEWQLYRDISGGFSFILNLGRRKSCVRRPGNGEAYCHSGGRVHPRPVCSGGRHAEDCRHIRLSVQSILKRVLFTVGAVEFGT